MAASSDPRIRLGAVDDHPFVLLGIDAALQQHSTEIVMVQRAASVAELLSGPGRTASIVLLDLHLTAAEDADITANVERIRSCGAEVIVLTSEIRPVPIREAVAAGALGVCLKADPISELISAIHAVHAGILATSGPLAHALVTDPRVAAQLTDREREVFDLLAHGVGRLEIGRLLDPPVTTHAVDACVKRVADRYRKLGRPTYNAYETLGHLVRDGHIDLGSIGPERDGGR